MKKDNLTHCISLQPEIAAILHQKSHQLALNGGPQTKGNQTLAEEIAAELYPLFCDKDRNLIDDYINENIPYLVIEGLVDSNIDGTAIVPPNEKTFPTLQELEQDIEILKLASQEQIILA